MTKTSCDVGMGKNNFFLFVKGKKKPVAKISVDKAYEDYKDGNDWGRKTCKRMFGEKKSNLGLKPGKVKITNNKWEWVKNKGDTIVSS